MTSPFSIPNDPRRDSVNRMIKALMKHRSVLQRRNKPLPKLTSHGNPIYPTQAEKDLEAKNWARLNTINNLIAKLEAIAY